MTIVTEGIAVNYILVASHVDRSEKHRIVEEPRIESESRNNIDLIHEILSGVSIIIAMEAIVIKIIQKQT